MARIAEAHPDAVTFNEACRGDVARIARRTGYELRFSRVIYLGEPLRSPSADVVPAVHSDHDVLLVRAQLTTRR